MQDASGHWCAELTADTTLESDYILLQLWLHPPAGRRLESAHAPLVDKAVRSPFWRGSFPMADSTFTAKGPSEVSATVKAYFALKLAGLRGGRSAPGAARASAFWHWAAFRRPTATSRST